MSNPKVGTAYVNMLIDAKDMDKQVADALDTDGFDKAAQKGSQRYSAAFGKYLEKEFKPAVARTFAEIDQGIANDKELRETIKKTLDVSDESGGLESAYREMAERLGVAWGGSFDDAIRSKVRKSFQKSLLEEAKSAAKRGDKDLLGSIVESFSAKGGKSSFNLLGPTFDRAEADLRKYLSDQEKIQDRARAKELAKLKKALMDRAKVLETFFDEESSRAAKRNAEEAREEDRARATQLKELKDAILARAKAEDKQNDLMRRMAEERLKLRKRYDAGLVSHERALNEALETLRKEAGKRNKSRYVREEQEARKALDRLVAARRKAEEALSKTVEEYSEDRVREVKAYSKEIIAAEERLADARVRIEDRVARDRAARAGRDRRLGSTLDSAGPSIGRMLGAGSRNNTLNLVGKSVGNLVSGFVKAGKVGAKMFSDFNVGFTSLGEGAKLSSRLLAGFGAAGSGALKSLAKTGPIAAAAVLVAAGALSVVASVLSALTAIVVALSATIMSALASALMVTGGLLIAVAAAAGLATLAFTSLTDAQKKAMGATFGPLKKDLAGLGQYVLDGLIPAFDTWAKNLHRALEGLGPMIIGVGQALGKAGSIITASLSGPGFQKLISVLAVELPTITKNLSLALGRTFNGLAGVFAAVMPSVTRFTDSIAKSAGEFNRWANSAKGQNAISDFMERAGRSARSAWDFVKQLGGAIADLLFNKDSQDAGNGMFDSLTESLKRFRKWVKEAQEDGRFKKWLADATEFAGDLKQGIIGVKDAFMTLESSGTLEVVGGAIRKVGNFMSDAAGFADKLMTALKSLPGPTVAAFAAFSPAGMLITPLMFLLGNLSTAIDRVKSSWTNLKEALSGGINLPNLPRLPDVLNDSLGRLSLPGTSAPKSPLTASPLTLDTSLGRNLGKDIGKGLEPVLKKFAKDHTPTPQEIHDRGEDALNNTSKSSGGNKPDSKGGSSGDSDSGDSDSGDRKKKRKSVFDAYSGLREDYFSPETLKSALDRIKNETKGLLAEAAKAANDALREAVVETTRRTQEILDDSTKEIRDRYIDVVAMVSGNLKDAWGSFSEAIAGAVMSTDDSAVSDSLRAVVDQALKASSAAMEEAQKSGAEAIERAREAAAAINEEARKAGADAVANAQATRDRMILDARAGEAQMIQEAEARVEAAWDALRAAGDNNQKRRAAEAALKKAQQDLDAARQRGDDLVRRAVTDGDALVANAQALSDQMIADAARKAEKLMEEAKNGNADMLKEAEEAQRRAMAAAAILEAQGVATPQNVLDLLEGIAVTNATLADYAAARGIVAERLEEANQKLADAISMRDSYHSQVASSVETFASMVSAQAKTINGVAQALTVTDLTDHMEARLTKIRSFQSNLRLLLAQGLSDAAYKQIVDAGVEQGGAVAEAILSGGSGGVAGVNDLVQQIGDAAEELGVEASSRLYQAGVDAAQGLVDGLNSLSGQLTSAAVALGEAIAQAVKDALGIASPSRVMIGMMGSVGDGVVVGLDSQRQKVTSASSRLAGAIAVSPEVAAYEVSQRRAAEVSVSGNPATGDQRPIDLTVITPTEDPHAVATEVLNELTGRL